MRELHILGGAIALLAGALALLAAKGSPLHRRSGLVFVGAMFVMAASGVVVATYLRPNPANIVAGTLTFYLVATALLAVRRGGAGSRAFAVGLLCMAIGVGLAGTALGIAAARTLDGEIDGVPGGALLLFAMFAGLGALGDARILAGRRLAANQRIARHLWRMTLAMWIATSSFFIGQSRFIPEPLRQGELLVIPPLLVLGLLAYWFVRTLRGRRLPYAGIARAPDRAATPHRTPAADATGFDHSG